MGAAAAMRESCGTCVAKSCKWLTFHIVKLDKSATCKGSFDAVVAMYHDQALIPLKLFGFERAVNITLGLPIIRTSPDHGTAFELAPQIAANPRSMIEAIKTAVIMANSSHFTADKVDS